jgi:hypothetical protein
MEALKIDFPQTFVEVLHIPIIGSSIEKTSNASRIFMYFD